MMYSQSAYKTVKNLHMTNQNKSEQTKLQNKLFLGDHFREDLSILCHCALSI